MTLEEHSLVSSFRFCTKKDNSERTLGSTLNEFVFQKTGGAQRPRTAAAGSHLGPPGGGLDGNRSRRQRRRNIHTGKDRSRETDRSSTAADAAENR